MVSYKLGTMIYLIVNVPRYLGNLVDRFKKNSEDIFQIMQLLSAENKCETWEYHILLCTEYTVATWG